MPITRRVYTVGGWPNTARRAWGPDPNNQLTLGTQRAVLRTVHK